MSWMAWTMPTAVFFASIAIALVAMTCWEIVRPTSLERGFLPMATTRGDRFFISLLSAAFIHLFWLALIPGPITIASLVSLCWAVALMRWG
jgi:predicted small integral membrane protein